MSGVYVHALIIINILISKMHAHQSCRYTEDTGRTEDYHITMVFILEGSYCSVRLLYEED